MGGGGGGGIKVVFPWNYKINDSSKAIRRRLAKFRLKLLRKIPIFLGKILQKSTTGKVHTKHVGGANIKSQSVLSQNNRYSISCFKLKNDKYYMYITNVTDVWLTCRN